MAYKDMSTVLVVDSRKRWDERAAPMIAYLKAFEDSYAEFPGFENELQGVYPSRARIS